MSLLFHAGEIINERIAADRKAKAEAQTRYKPLVLAHKDATRADAEELLRVIELLGLAMADVHHDVRAIEQVASTQTQVDRLAKASTEAGEALRAAEDAHHAAEMREIGKTNRFESGRTGQDIPALRQAAEDARGEHEIERNRLIKLKAAAPRMF